MPSQSGDFLSSDATGLGNLVQQIEREAVDPELALKAKVGGRMHACSIKTHTDSCLVGHS